MDPNATLNEIYALIAAGNYDHARPLTVDEALRNRQRLIEKFQELDEWFRKGGFKPTPWNHPQRTECGPRNPDEAQWKDDEYPCPFGGFGVHVCMLMDEHDKAPLKDEGTQSEFWKLAQAMHICSCGEAKHTDGWKKRWEKESA